MPTLTTHLTTSPHMAVVGVEITHTTDPARNRSYQVFLAPGPQGGTLVTTLTGDPRHGEDRLRQIGVIEHKMSHPAFLNRLSRSTDGFTTIVGDSVATLTRQLITELSLGHPITTEPPVMYQMLIGEQKQRGLFLCSQCHGFADVIRGVFDASCDALQVPTGPSRAQLDYAFTVVTHGVCHECRYSAPTEDTPQTRYTPHRTFAEHPEALLLTDGSDDVILAAPLTCIDTTVPAEESYGWLYLESHDDAMALDPGTVASLAHLCISTLATRRD